MNKAWSKVRLGEVAKLHDNSVPTSKLGEVNLAGVYSFARGLFKRGPMSPAETSYKTFNRLVTDDFVISQPKAWEGALARVTPEFDGWFLSPVFPTFRADRERLEPAFLEWFCKREPVWTQLASKSRGIGARRETVSSEQFLTLEIPLPQLAEQRRVVARIEGLYSQVGDARTVRRQASEQVSSLEEAASRGIFSGLSPLARLEEFCPIITDGTHQTPHYTDNGAIFLSAQNVKPFRFLPEKHRKVSREDFHGYTARNKPRRGDVLLTRVGAGIGEAALVDRDIEFAIYVSLALIRTDETRLLPEYLVHWLNSPDGRESSRKETLGRGHSQGNLNLKLLRGVLLPVPALPEQRRIVAELDAVQAEVDTLKALQGETATELDAMLPAILDLAFKGTL